MSPGEDDYKFEEKYKKLVAAVQKDIGRHNRSLNNFNWKKGNNDNIHSYTRSKKETKRYYQMDKIEEEPDLEQIKSKLSEIDNLDRTAKKNLDNKVYTNVHSTLENITHSLQELKTYIEDYNNGRI